MGLLRHPLMALGGVLLGVAAPWAQTFSSRIEAVRVDVLVTARAGRGRPDAADFEVLDNGVRQTVDLASFEEIPLNVSSRSI